MYSDLVHAPLVIINHVIKSPRAPSQSYLHHVLRGDELVFNGSTERGPVTDPLSKHEVFKVMVSVYLYQPNWAMFLGDCSQ
jgi:hypothetical protein